MLFYRLGDPVKEISVDEISHDSITAGYINIEELQQIYQKFDFGSDTVESSQSASSLFRTGAEVHNDYTFTELRVASDNGEDDFISIYLKKNFLLVVDIRDRDGSTRDSFAKAINRFPVSKLKAEKVVCFFLESLISGGAEKIEMMRNAMTEMEEAVVTDSAGDEFGSELINLKKKLLHLQTYYEQILDVALTLEENENEIFSSSNLFYFSNLSKKVERLKNDVTSLNNALDHLQDAYSAFLDVRMNRTMKVLTVLTTLFFPLTIIVGWYGMNFQSMPEFTWRYGYIYVIALSITVVVVLCMLAKKHKWF